MSEEVQELIQKLDSLEEGFRQNRLMTATLAKTAKACLSKAKLTDRLTEARCDLDATIMEAIKAEAIALRQVRAEYIASAVPGETRKVLGTGKSETFNHRMMYQEGRAQVFPCAVMQSITSCGNIILEGRRVFWWTAGLS